MLAQIGIVGSWQQAKPTANAALDGHKALIDRAQKIGFVGRVQFFVTRCQIPGAGITAALAVHTGFQIDNILRRQMFAQGFNKSLHSSIHNLPPGVTANRLIAMIGTKIAV
jgi:hypothetical protein